MLCQWPSITFKWPLEMRGVQRSYSVAPKRWCPVVTVTPSVRVSAGLEHLKLFINHSSSKNLCALLGIFCFLLLVQDSIGCGFFCSFFFFFVLIYLASVRGQQETLCADEYCHPASTAFCYIALFLHRPPMPTLTWNIISEKCFWFGMSWDRFKK